MTPQERERVAELFDRLAQLENNPRERDAEAAIAEGLQRAPNATYALVQTVLIQEEALQRANERISQLEQERGLAESPRTGGGFLDSMREAFSGQPRAPRTSVPATRMGSAPMGVPPGFRQDAGTQPAQPAQPQMGRGGSFLGQAAAIAAGVVVGSLAVDALRGHFGSRAGEAKAGELQPNETHEARETEEAREPDRGEYETADAGDSDFDGGSDFGGDFGGGDI
jgi:hypothetical protein